MGEKTEITSKFYLSLSCDDPLTGKPYEDLTTEEKQDFFAWTRKHGMYETVDGIAIGGSDVSIVYGVNPWQTPYELYQSKRGEITKEITDNQKHIFAAGHAIEPYYRDFLFPDVSGLKTIDFPYQFQSIKYPHCLANIDGLVVDKDGKVGIYEGKSISTMNYRAQQKWKAGIAPYYYILQTRFYMEVLNLDFAYIVCGWGTRSDGIAWVRVEREALLGQTILEDMEDFSINTESGLIPPNLTESEYPELVRRDIERFYADSEKILEKTEVKDEEFVSLAKNLAKYNEATAELLAPYTLLKEERERDAAVLENECLEWMLKNGKVLVYCADDEFSAGFDFGKKARKGVDRKMLEEEFPDVFEKIYHPIEPKEATLKVKTKIKPA